MKCHLAAIAAIAFAALTGCNCSFHHGTLPVASCSAGGCSTYPEPACGITEPACGLQEEHACAEGSTEFSVGDGCSSGGCSSGYEAGYAPVIDSGSNCDHGGCASGGGLAHGGLAHGGLGHSGRLSLGGGQAIHSLGHGASKTVMGGVGLIAKTPIAVSRHMVNHMQNTLHGSHHAQQLMQKVGQGCASGCCNLPMGPESGGQVRYPYYTTRGPRDFLMANPPSIGP